MNDSINSRSKLNSVIDDSFKQSNSYLEIIKALTGETPDFNLNNFNSIQLPKDKEEILDGETFNADAFVHSIVKRFEAKRYESHHQELMECLLNLPPLEVMDNPITINHPKKLIWR